MNVLIIARGYPTENYKMNGIFEFDQAKALVKAGINVIYAAVDVRSIRRWRKWGHESFVKDGVQVEAINLPIGKISNKSLEKIRNILLGKLYKKIVYKYGKPDIVHSHFIVMGIATANLFKNQNIPLVHTEHFSGMNQKYISEYYKYLGNNTYTFMNRIIAVSSYLAKNINNEFGINATVLPNIVDTSKFRYKSVKKSANVFNFISVGNLLPNKRMDLLINSFYSSFKENKDVKLYIYGDGPERKELETLIKDYEMSNQIFLMGLVERKVIAHQMQQSHCFVLVSKLETFGVAYIEALASGLPVIATRCGGPEDFINKSNGILLIKDSREELSQALTKMYKNVDKYDSKKISEEITKKYSEQNVAQLLIKEYKDTIN